MRSSDKYEALFSCLSSRSSDASETSLITGETSVSTISESSDGSSSDEESASVRSCSNAPKVASPLFRTIFRVVLIAGAAVLGLKGICFAKRKSRACRAEQFIYSGSS